MSTDGIEALKRDGILAWLSSNKPLSEKPHSRRTTVRRWSVVQREQLEFSDRAKPNTVQLRFRSRGFSQFFPPKGSTPIAYLNRIGAKPRPIAAPGNDIRLPIR
jgi:hypothetical protein